MRFRFKKPTADISSVDLDAMTAQLDTGEKIPVTNMFRENGAETIFAWRCRRAVAGPCSDGSWYVFMVEPPDEDVVK